MPHADIDGTRFHYQQAGTGPDVVLLHAATGNLAVWMFIGIIDALATEFRVTAYDLRGHGHTGVTPTGYTSADMARDLFRLQDELGLGPAYLVGHSFGAVVAAHAAALGPDRVRGVVLSDPYFPGLKHVEPNVGGSHVWAELRDSFAAAGVPLPGGDDFTGLFETVARLTDGQRARLKESMGAGSARWLSGLPRLAGTAAGREMFDPAGLGEAELRSLRVPAVALYDEFTPFAATRDFLARELSNWSVEAMPGASHVAPLQNSAKFVELVAGHLRRMANP